ncbi:MAG: hypothetical protein GF398_17700 [Chitinivibrionales bacterium]|nr:hypothetical protein [Chitinivibrionales bacterium]
MVTRTVFLGLAVLLAGKMSTTDAQLFGNPTRTDIGVGTEATGLSQNYTAVAQGSAALFWNPAGLAFLDGHNGQAGIGGLRTSTTTLFSRYGTGSEVETSFQRIRPGNIAYSRGIQGRRRGFGFGLGYQNPYLLDAVLNYSGSYTQNGDAIELRNYYKSKGQLDFWTGGFGFQIAPEFGVGLALSVVTGSSTEELIFEKRTNGAIADADNDAYLDYAERSYRGLDARLGLLLRPTDAFSLGMRIAFPSAIDFSESGREELPAKDGEYYAWSLDGDVRSYYSGALGLSYRFPFMLISADLAARAPDPDAYSYDNQRNYWQMGGGVGVEVALVPSTLRGRIGYRYQDFDPNPYLVYYDGEVFGENDLPVESEVGEHTFATGLSYCLTSNIKLDAAYSVRKFTAATGNALSEDRYDQRLLGGIAFNY